jgi:hypothetical protein
MILDEQITQFADMLRKLAVEYEIFFSGGRKLPPTNLRFKVDSLLKQLMEVQMSYAQKFRYNQLVAKYSLYRDLWRRNTQEKEEGGVLRPEREIESLLRARRVAIGEEELPPDQLTTVIRNPSTETQKIEEVYRNVQEMRARFGDKPLDLSLEQFVRLIQLKSAELTAGNEQRPVEFVVYHDEQQKRVRFVARPGEAEEKGKEPPARGPGGTPGNHEKR